MTRWHILTALLCGAVLAISRDTGQFGWLALAACVPLLVLALRAPRPRDVALLLFVPAWMGEAGPMWFYGRLLPMVYGLAVAQALVFMLAALFMRALYRRFPTGVAPLGFAAMLAAIDYLHSLVSPNGSFFALGYTLVDVVPLLQTAALAGVAGLSFLAAVIPAGLAVLYVRPRDLSGTLAWSVPVLAALAYGVWQLVQPAGPAVRIALLSDDRYAGHVFNHPEAAPEVAAAFARQIAAAAAHAPSAIVVPEKILAAGTVLAPPAGSVVVAGLDGPAPQGGRLNIAALYRPGTPVDTYLKKRMVPGYEADYVRGAGELVTRLGDVHAGIAICKDMDFAQDLRLYGRRDVGLMLVPAWDFDRDAYLHGRMAVVRGVENGFAVARSASQGLMTLSDAHGRVVAERRTAHAPGMLVGDLPTGRGRTVYSRIGDVFAQVAVAAWLVLLALLAWRWRRVQDSPARRM
ncbi:hypothetical protein ACCD08_13465 [Telluria sp. Tellsp104]